MEIWAPLNKAFTSQQTQQCKFERPLSQLVELLITKCLFIAFNNLYVNYLANQNDLEKGCSYSLRFMHVCRPIELSQTAATMHLHNT